MITIDDLYAPTELCNDGCAEEVDFGLDILQEGEPSVIRTRHPEEHPTDEVLFRFTARQASDMERHDRRSSATASHSKPQSVAADQQLLVLEYEAIIHEFDPWFNYRTTKKLVDDGIYDFYSWFDVDVWYPLGRIVGGTIYPGLMVTSMIFSKILHFFNFPVDTRIICVFLAPVFSGVTAMVAYWFTAEIWNTGEHMAAAAVFFFLQAYGFVNFVRQHLTPAMFASIVWSLVIGLGSIAEAYSSPSIILSMRTHTGQRIIYDDYREAYQWLRTNTARDAKIMSWWDYGYQITGMSNRTVLVDNNTWNNTHIATVGKAMASQEDISYQIMKKMDVEFALVIFGGFAGYSGDDINKFLWMVRIAGTLDSDIQESDYMSRTGNYVMDASGGKAMLNSLMYKLSYYRFAEMKMGENTPEGYDRVRNTEIGVKNIKLEYMEEAFTTEHWILRIYRVKPESNRKPTPVPSKPLVSSFATAPK
eukprot:gene16252-24910_t